MPPEFDLNMIKTIECILIETHFWHQSL